MKPDPCRAGLAQAGVMAASFAEQGPLGHPGDPRRGAGPSATLFGAPGMARCFGTMLERPKAAPPALADPGPWFKAYPCWRGALIGPSTPLLRP